MKRLKFSLLIVLLLPVLNSNAQSFYAKIYGGIGYFDSQQQGSYFYPLQFFGTTILKDNITPIGNGAYWGAGAGYFFSKYLGEDFSVEYMTGYENGEVYIDPDFGEQETIQFSGKLSAVFLMPGLIVSSNNEKRFFGYVRLGPEFNYYNFEANYYSITDGTSSSQQSYSGLELFGYSFAIGAEYALKNHIHFFLEGSTKSNSFSGSAFDLNANLFGATAGVKYSIGK